MSPTNDEQTGEFFYEDRSGADLDDDCGMAYFWNRLYGTCGIVPKEEAFALKIGRETHEDLAVIADLEDIRPENIDALIREITDPLTADDKIHQQTMETLYRRLGWLAAFALFIEPKIRERFITIQNEAEIIFDRDPLWVAVTPDRVLCHREDGYLVYREYKTTISASPKWMASWPFQIQPHIGMAAIQEELAMKIAYTQVVGLMKGDVRNGRLAHPYVWGYRNASTGEWTHDYDKARGSSWEPAPVWEYPGGVVEWVSRIGEEVARSQFPHSAPVFLNERMLNNWVERRIARQREIQGCIDVARFEEDVRNLYFEQRTKKCKPAFGDACPYLAACWNAEINANPLASGLYVERTPHHEVEVQLLRAGRRVA